MVETQIELLRKMAAFGGLKPTVIELIHSQSRVVVMPPGDFFFHEGDPGESLYIIERGTALVLRECDGKSIDLGTLGAGDCFGEMALIDFRARSASVKAETECQTLQVPRQSLGALYRQDIEQYAIVMMNLGREVSRRLRATDERLFELRQHQLTPTT